MQDRPADTTTSPTATVGFLRRPFAWFGLQRGDETRALLVFAYLFLIISSYLLLKAVRNAFFIAEYGAMKLPWVMLGIAVLAGGFAAVYIRLSRRIATVRLTVLSLLFFASNLAGFWWLALSDRPWLYPVLYLWTGLFGVVGTTQVWTLVNELFTTREAKRAIGLVGTGGILGGAAGGWMASRLAPVIGTPNLLLVVTAMLLLAVVAVYLISRTRIPRQDATRGQAPPENLTQSIRVVSASAHLRVLAGLIFISALATTSVDFQFNVVVGGAIEGRDALTAFFGTVYMSVAILGFFLQLLLTSRLLKHIGIGVSILLLPLSLAAGTVMLFTTGALWAGVLLKGGDGIFKHSLDRSCRELLYLPVAADVKVQAKSTIDTVMDRLGDGSAGALQLLVTWALGLGLQASLAANFVLIGVWFVLARLSRHTYVNELRAAVGKMRRGPSEVDPGQEADARQALEEMLASDNEIQRLGALEWAAQASIPVEEPQLLRLVRDDGSPAVRRAALGQLLGGGDVELPPRLLEQLEQEGHSLLIASIDMLLEAETGESQDKLEALMGDAGDTTRLSLVAFTMRRLGPEFTPFANRIFESLLVPTAPAHARRAAVRALCLLPPESPLHERLAGLLDDEDPTVVDTAVRTAGRLLRADLLDRLIVLLARPRLRAAVRESLVRFGDDVVPLLVRARALPAVRRHVPGALGAIGSDRAMQALVDALEDQDPEVHARALSALSRLRRRFPERQILEGQSLLLGLADEAGRYDRLLAAERVFRQGDERTGEAGEWLLRAVAEDRDRVLERIFTLIELGFPSQDMRHAWSALREGSSRQRANAVELLDNVLPRTVKRHVLPLIEAASASVPGFTGKQTPTVSIEQALTMLAGDSVSWLAACAFYAAREGRFRHLELSARAAMQTHDRVLGEEAEAYISALFSKGVR